MHSFVRPTLTEKTDSKSRQRVEHKKQEHHQYSPRINSQPPEFHSSGTSQASHDFYAPDNPLFHDPAQSPLKPTQNSASPASCREAFPRSATLKASKKELVPQAESATSIQHPLLLILAEGEQWIPACRLQVSHNLRSPSCLPPLSAQSFFLCTAEEPSLHHPRKRSCMTLPLLPCPIHLSGEEWTKPQAGCAHYLSLQIKPP